jgi:hypothetical protein
MHSLLLEEQAMFKTIMLIPIGALIVVFLHVLIGLKTSGTFMPVLIAVVFVQTQLLPGIIGFLLIVVTGLVIRAVYLSSIYCWWCKYWWSLLRFLPLCRSILV